MGGGVDGYCMLLIPFLSDQLLFFHGVFALSIPSFLCLGNILDGFCLIMGQKWSGRDAYPLFKEKSGEGLLQQGNSPPDIALPNGGGQSRVTHNDRVTARFGFGWKN